jgi:hypothetical protein
MSRPAASLGLHCHGFGFGVAAVGAPTSNADTNALTSAMHPSPDTARKPNRTSRRCATGVT